MGKKELNKNKTGKKNIKTEVQQSQETILDTVKKSTLQFANSGDNIEFLKLAEACPSLIIIYDNQHVYYVNKAVTILTGYSVKDFLKIKFKDIIHPEDLETVEKRVAQRLSGKRISRSIEFRIVAVNNEVKWIEFAADILEYKGKKCAIGIALDITVKKEIEIDQSIQTNKRIFFQSILLKLSRLEKLDIFDVYKTITRQVAEAIGTERVSIWKFIENETILHCEVLYILSKNIFDTEDEINADLFPVYINALSNNRQITANNALENPYTKAFSDSYLIPNKISSMIDIPVRIQGKVVGVVCVEHTGPSREWTSEEQFFLNSVVEVLTIYIEFENQKKAEDQLKKTYQELNKAFRKSKERQEIIEVEREQLEVTLKSIGDGVITTDYEGRVLLMNITAERLTGWKQTEAFGRHIDEIFIVTNEDTNKRIITPIEKVLKTGQIVEMSNRTKLVSKSGELRIISNCAAPIRDRQGNIFGVILVFRDTTEQKLAEEHLRESEEGYRTLFESANDANFILEDGVFTECNKMAEKILQCSKEQIIGKSPGEFSPELQPDGRDSATVAKEKIEQALQGNPQVFEWKHSRFDGSLFEADVTLHKIHIQGKQYVQAIVRDITERKKAEEKLKESENLLQNIIQMANISMAIVSFDGTIEYINEHAFKTFGYRHDEIPNMDRWWLLAYPDENYRQKVIDQYMGLVNKAIRENKEIERREYFVTCKDGSIKTMIIFGIIVNQKAFVMFEDITERKKAEEAIRQSETQFRITFENAPIGMCMTGTDGHFILVNRSLCEMLGYSKDELQNSHISKFTHPDDIDASELTLKKDIEGEHISSTFEKRYIHKDGHVIWVNISSSLIRDADGLPKYLIAQILDITDRKNAEEALLKSEERYRILVELSPDPILVHSEGIIEYANDACLKTMGAVSQDELVGKNVIEFVHPDERMVAIERIKLATHNDNVAPLVTEKFIKLDGSVIEVEVTAVPFENRNKLSMFTVFRDITELKQAEAALKQSEEKYRSLIETTDTGFVILNEQGIVLDANSNYIKLAGYNTLNEILNHNILEWTDEKARERNFEAIKSCLERGYIRNFEIDYIHKDSEVIPVEISATVENTNKGRIILSLAHDISKRKMAEKLVMQSEMRYRRLFESSKDGILILDAGTGKIVDVNPYLYFMLGCTNHDFLGKIIWEIGLFKNIIGTKEKIIELQRMEYIRYENLPLETADGHRIYVEFISNVYFVDHQKVIQCNIRDITERREMEDALQKNEKLYRATFENTGTANVLIEEDSIISYANAEFERLSGYAKKDIEGKKKWTEFVVKEDFKWMQAQHKLRREMREAALKHYEFRFVNREGSIRSIYLTVDIIPGTKKSIASLLDITERKREEEILKENEEKFRLLFTSTSQAVTLNEIILDENGKPCDYRILEANPSFEIHTGLSYKEVIGKRVLDILPNTEKLWIEECGQVALTGVPLHIEDYARELKRYYDYTIYSPKHGQFAIISTDITERKYIESAKQLNISRLEALVTLNNMVDKPVNEITEFSLEEGVKLTGSDIGYLAFTNKDESVFTMYAFSKTAVKQFNIKDKIFQFFTEKTALLSEVIRKRKAVVTNNYKQETLPKNGFPDGHIEIKRFMSIPIFEGEHIVAIAAVGNKEKNYNDVDVMQFSLLMNGMWRLIQRKKSNEALKESEERYRLITNNSKDIIAKFGTDGKLSFISPACKTLLGYEINEMLNHSVFEFFHQADIPDLRIYQENLLKQVAPNLVKHRLRKADGSYIWLETNNQIINDADGNIKEVVAVIRDITELLNSEKLIKEKEAAELANKAKSEFLANMSHEIRNPLNSIIGLSNSLSRSSLNAEHKEIVESIKISSNNLLNILNDILDFSKIEANKVEIVKNIFDVEILIKDITASYKSIAEHKNLTISYKIENDVPPLLVGDSGKLKQMVINLVGNAIKFTEKGIIKIFVNLSRVVNEQVFLKIEISDTGIGIKKEDYNRLFNSFTQLDSSTTKSFAGTGLGLAIVRSYALLMKGTIEFISEYEKGSTFILEIPFEIPNEHQTVVKPKIQAMDFSKYQVRLLLAEDDGINQLYLKGLLTGHGISVDTAYNGLQALDKFDANNYDIILMDGQMPKMDGFEATRTIRQREKTKNLHTPIIAITGYAVSGDKEKFLAAGMDDYVSKPVDENRLLELIHKYTIKKIEG